MNLWIKYRFLVAGLLFVLPSVGALLMVYFKCINNTDLLYPLALTIIGLAFTSAQFYFQVNENRFHKLESESKSIREKKRDVLWDFIYNTQLVLDIVNTSLGSGKFENDVFALEREVILGCNKLRIKLRDYYSIYFQDLTHDSNPFLNLLGDISAAITNMRIEIEKGNSAIKTYNFYFKDHNKTWRDLATEFFKEIEFEREKLLGFMKDEVH
tara:strand:- start:733 stop:1368 length:636 start_codon:yes stop_codon:yes gene_type:complete